jgi:hypothetical protein
MRTARSRKSGEYVLGRAMGSIFSRNEPSDKPGAIQCLIIPFAELKANLRSVRTPVVVFAG